MSTGLAPRWSGIPQIGFDLAWIVSKCLGETGENLSVVLAAEGARNSMLRFDEADVLFGRRTAVADADDRYDNIEASCMSHRLEGGAASRHF